MSAFKIVLVQSKIEAALRGVSEVHARLTNQRENNMRRAGDRHTDAVLADSIFHLTQAKAALEVAQRETKEALMA